MDSRGEELLAVAAVHHLGLVLSDRWPMVAAYLLAAGADGEELRELASLSRAADSEDIYQLIPGAVEDANLPELTDEAATEVVTRLLVQARTGSGHPALRALADLYRLDHPGELIAEAYELADRFDYAREEVRDLHHDARSGWWGRRRTNRWARMRANQFEEEARMRADRFEEALHTLPRLAIPDGLLDALVPRGHAGVG